jgi:hypothetical protein
MSQIEENQDRATPAQLGLQPEVKPEILEKPPESAKEITKLTAVTKKKKLSEKQIAWSKEIGRNSQKI